MQTDRNLARRWLRAGTLACIALAGLGAIVGSGGGFSDAGCCGPLTPAVSIEPPRTTVEVGTSASFTANAFIATAPLSYQWRRNGVAIAGATAATYNLAGANLGDDGVEFSVVLTAANSSATASALLRVSSAPAVRFQDAEFAPADWSVTAVTDPATNGPTHAESQSLTGGNPGSMRTIDYQVPLGRGSIRVFHTALSATYDPAVLGAVYVVDVTVDCKRLSATTSPENYATPAFEQAGRWYTLVQTDFCGPDWGSALSTTGLLAGEFRLIAGPACAGGQSCPDFSVGAAPLRWGFASGLNMAADGAAGSLTQGIDNWRVNVWTC